MVCRWTWVSFYYMANAMGRLLGTLLSGLVIPAGRAGQQRVAGLPVGIGYAAIADGYYFILAAGAKGVGGSFILMDRSVPCRIPC